MFDPFVNENSNPYFHLMNIEALNFDRFDLVNILCHIIIDDILEAVLDWQFDLVTRSNL